jgi:inosose dehydratase
MSSLFWLPPYIILLLHNRKTKVIMKRTLFTVVMSIVALLCVSAQQETPYMKPAPKADKFHLGMAGFTFVNFDIDKTLDTMQRLGVHRLCIKDFHLPLSADASTIAAFKEKLASHGVEGYAVGPIYMKTEAEVDRAFDYAQRVGVKMIVGVPNYELLDYVEEKVKATDIRLAIHLHGPDMPIYPSATDIWNNVSKRDKRMGMCLDIGHDLRYNQDPLKDLKRYRSRIFDIHLKDVTGNAKADHAIELGRGRIDFRRFVTLLRKIGYSGSCSLEYEKDMKDPFMGIAESVGYFRAVCDMTH